MIAPSLSSATIQPPLIAAHDLTVTRAGLETPVLRGVSLTVAPGEIATPMTQLEEEQAWSEERPGNPVGRPGHVDEVAAVVAKAHTS